MLHQFITYWNACGKIAHLETVGSSDLSYCIMCTSFCRWSYSIIVIILIISLSSKTNKRNPCCYCCTVASEDSDESCFIGGLPSVLPIHGVSTGSNSRWALSKRHKKDSKHKMSTNRGISPSLSITLWSHMKKNREELSRPSPADRRTSGE